MTTARRDFRRRAALSLLAVSSFSFALAGCTSESGNNTTEGGYQAGDGSFRQWTESERGEAVVITGTDYNGTAVDTSSLQGQVVVINTWYAACPPCRAEAPALVAVHEANKADGVVFLGINGTDSAATAHAFEREHGITWNSIDDSKGAAIAALQKYVPVRAVPTTVILDAQGRVAARVLGEVNETTLSQLIDDVKDTKP